MSETLNSSFEFDVEYCIVRAATMDLEPLMATARSIAGSFGVVESEIFEILDPPL